MYKCVRIYILSVYNIGAADAVSLFLISWLAGLFACLLVEVCFACLLSLFATAAAAVALPPGNGTRGLFVSTSCVAALSPLYTESSWYHHLVFLGFLLQVFT